MIDPKAEPLFNRPPYKRIDLARKKRPASITLDEVHKGEQDTPDLEYYTFIYGFGWVLKELD